MKRPLGKLLNRTSGGLCFFFGRFLQKFLVILVGIDFYMSFGDRICLLIFKGLYVIFRPSAARPWVLKLF